MGIFDMFMGGASNNDGSLLDSAKQAIMNNSILQQIAGQGQTPQMTSVPQQGQQGGGIADLMKNLGRFGAGMSKTAGFSRTPVSFGQAMAGGVDNMTQGQDADLERQYKEAQIGALKNKGINLENAAQTALVKSNMGIPLTPQEQASLQAYDTMNQAKLTYSQDKFGNFIPQPAARSIIPQGMQQTNPSGSQAPDLQGLRGYYQYLQSKMGQ